MTDLQQELDKYLPQFIEETKKMYGVSNSFFDDLNAVCGNEHRKHCKTKARFGRYSENCERCAWLRMIRSSRRGLVINRPIWGKVSEIHLTSNTDIGIDTELETVSEKCR